MKKIFITLGDYNGIGVEIVIKSLLKLPSIENQYIILGSDKIYNFYKKILGIKNFKFKTIESIDTIKDSGIYIYNIENINIDIKPGELTKDAGEAAGKSIVLATKYAKKYNGSIVTPPINKESLHMGGFYYPGHTEFISNLLGNEKYLMILDGEIIRVALVTTHLPLKDVSKNLSEDIIYSKGLILYNSLVKDYGIKNPTIGICSLNPHASDGGLFGDEEKKIIEPAARKLRTSTNCNILGPLPSDTMFTKSFVEKVDAYLVMYHDQGLIPLKLLTFGKGINFTAGLSIVRTSPDHGTAFNIAGKGIADYHSMYNALISADLFMESRRVLK